MKTSWSVSYLVRHYPEPALWDWAKAKSAELSEKYGVPFHYFVANGRIYVLPYLAFARVTPDGSEEERKALLSHLRYRGHTFTSLAEATGWSLPKVLSVAKFLVILGEAALDVAGNGRPHYLKRRAQ